MSLTDMQPEQYPALRRSPTISATKPQASALLECGVLSASHPLNSSLNTVDPRVSRTSGVVMPKGARQDVLRYQLGEGGLHRRRPMPSQTTWRPWMALACWLRKRLPFVSIGFRAHFCSDMRVIETRWRAIVERTNMNQISRLTWVPSAWEKSA